MPVTLRTPRLVLRQWNSSDRDPFAEMNADPEVMEFLPSLLDRQGSDAMASGISTALAAQGWGLWALESVGTGEFLGFTGLSHATFEAPFTPAVEVGWRLARRAWGKGFATEAAVAAVAFGFEELGLPEIVSFTAVGNRRSRAVMERLGMTYAPDEDFDHPKLRAGHPLGRHVLYRLARPGGTADGRRTATHGRRTPTR
ncbi:GNAT family N-acetyltransferase [Streptomyces sp. NPDC055607]